MSKLRFFGGWHKKLRWTESWTESLARSLREMPAGDRAIRVASPLGGGGLVGAPGAILKGGDGHGGIYGQQRRITKCNRRLRHLLRLSPRPESR